MCSNGNYIKNLPPLIITLGAVAKPIEKRINYDCLQR
nr:MAG TPA: hypothetical protein [Caudoviricetes sp.]